MAWWDGYITLQKVKEGMHMSSIGNKDVMTVLFKSLPIGGRFTLPDRTGINLYIKATKENAIKVGYRLYDKKDFTKIDVACSFDQDKPVLVNNKG